MVGEINNKHLINAPAGSGKTTSIKNYLKSIILNNPSARILCITYTNRATEELSKDLEKTNVTISTIHSYINNLIKPFFREKDIINLYWDIFNDRIIQRIENKDDDANIAESNTHYIDKFGSLNVDTVKENLTEISYGETQFTSYYYGKLSHDDLLMFAYSAIKKFPNLLRKIGEKYNYIFIDEYQDTSAFVLKIFYAAVKNKPNVQLFLLGDRMQQIYQNYDGSFEKELAEFDTSMKLETNYRSLPAIVNILNKIYNDEIYKQKPSDENKDKQPDFAPKIIISDDIEKTVEEIQAEISDILTLHLMNKEKYLEIGAINLYNGFASMEMYSYSRKYSVSDVLSDLSGDNPDVLMRFLFFAVDILNHYKQCNYGVVISKCKKQTRFIDPTKLSIIRNSDKDTIKAMFDKILEACSLEECKIKDCLNIFYNLGLMKSNFYDEVFENFEYNKVLEIKLSEVEKIHDYLNRPTISTQHGVKGESHKSVAFIAADSRDTPNVRMYDFFNLWAHNDFSLTEFEDLYYDYLKSISGVYHLIGKKTSELRSEDLNQDDAIKNVLNENSTTVLERFKNNHLFNYLLKSDYDNYLKKQNVTSAKKVFNKAKIEGVLTAYKLFYVGCSRARINLIIIVDKKKISSYKDQFIKKAESIGFLVENGDYE